MCADSSNSKGKGKVEKLWSLVEDYYLDMTPESIQNSFANHLEYSQAKTRFTATRFDCFKSLAYAIRDRIMERWNDTQQTYYKQDCKRIYYLSLEYLMGRALTNTLINLGVENDCISALRELGYSLEDLQSCEPDAGLGNGGLGRLAACFLDSMATLQLPGMGYGIRYDYGIFEQQIKEGFQLEKPDHWLRYGYPWEIVRPEYSVQVQFYGQVRQINDRFGNTTYSWEQTENVIAVPYDMPIVGYRNETVNTLRLWSAKATEEFDLADFNKGEYIHAVEMKVLSENITRVLYPKDDFESGRELRLRQEYFFVSATLQDLIRRYKTNHDTFDDFPVKVAIQLNDTHPAIAIAELMRIFVDVEGLEWQKSFDICVSTFGYTNHTVLPEALEEWRVSLMELLLPRHLQIIYLINHNFLQRIEDLYPGDQARMRRMSIIREQPHKAVRMAHLAIVGSHAVNGVAALHTEILKERIFPDFFELWPAKFNNKTNGITQRRWLALCNPRLADLITKTIGDEWVTDLTKLKQLIPHARDAAFRTAWAEVKTANKEDLARFIAQTHGVDTSADAIFDCHIKRIHEYKRQLLNLLHIITLYNRIKDDPAYNLCPRVFIFAGKAAPGYFMAKRIIKLINAVGKLINRDADVQDRLKVVFLSNYSVTLAQRIIPAADVSEQTSTAGKEASGTGNMKLALNGALTIGTLDGANIEIKDAVGDKNIFIYGLTAPEVVKMKAEKYNPWEYYADNAELKRVLNMIGSGFFSPEDPGLFRPIFDSLTQGGDEYLVLADYASYIASQQRIDEVYCNQDQWITSSILNTANVGIFSSDRTIAQYNEEIWKVKPQPPKTKQHKILMQGR